MTVRSCRLDLTLSAHLMSDGSGWHCRMMSESPRQFKIFTAHNRERVCCTFHVNNCGHAVSECFHVHAQHIQSVSGRNIFLVALHNWEFTVFDDALCSLVWLGLRFTFDA